MLGFWGPGKIQKLTPGPLSCEERGGMGAGRLEWPSVAEPKLIALRLPQPIELKSDIQVKETNG